MENQEKGNKKYQIKIISDILDILYYELEVPAELYKSWIQNDLLINMDVCYCKFDSEKVKIPVESVDIDNIFYKTSEVKASNLFEKIMYKNYPIYTMVDNLKNRVFLLPRKTLENVILLDEKEENNIFKIIIDMKYGFSKNKK